MFFNLTGIKCGIIQEKRFRLAPRVNREHVLVPLGLTPERSHGNGNVKSESVRDERLITL